jgi:hypothetical protein
VSSTAHDEHVAVRQVQHVDDLAQRGAVRRGRPPCPRRTWSWNSSSSSGGGSVAASTTSRVPRSSSAALRSGTPVEADDELAGVVAGRSTVSGPRSAGSVSRTDPAAKRGPGSSVRTSTVTSPLMPLGLADATDDQQVGLAGHLGDRGMD